MKDRNENKPLKAVLYLRLSKEDLDKLSPEEKSISIKNQEMMLKAYAEKEKWEVIGIYNDEDYSGADRDRPNFNKMIKECEDRKVDVVLVKTQARFARDIELIDKYVHNKFIEWGVRFVTYIEGIDNTRYETKKTSQITAMKDEWMLEDTSINIRETLKSKRRNGDFTGSFAPYGYMKDPENNNHLIIDNKVSNNIIRIFEEYSRGYGMAKIAGELTCDNILSPLEYKLFNGINLKIPVMRGSDNYKDINKAGLFVIRIHCVNDKRQIIKNLNTIEVLADKIAFNNKLDITLVKVKSDKIKFYYSVLPLEKLKIKIDNDKLNFSNKFNFDNRSLWKPFTLKEVLPKNITCIASHLEELDRTHEIYYEFEVCLRENRRHNHYSYKVYPKCDNENVDLSYDVNIRNKHMWSAKTIRKILSDEVYRGNLVQFKTTTVSYKNHTVIYNDKEKMIKVCNTHEAIVELELWNEVQKKLNQRKRCCSNGKVHMLANKVFCEICGSIFFKCGNIGSNNLGYLCCRDKKNKWSNCDNNKFIREDELHEFIRDRINKMLSKLYDEKELEKINNEMIENDLFSEKTNGLVKEKNDIKKRLENKNLYFQGLYEDRKKGFIDDEEYMFLKCKYKEDYRDFEKRLKLVEEQIRNIELKKEKLKDKNWLFKKYRQLDELRIEFINEFIDKIIIGKYAEETCERKIHIIWNFTDLNIKK